MSEQWRARALIRSEALHHNLSRIRELIGPAKLMAVIKADAYGHGLKTVSQIIREKVDAFAVATLSEAIQCRKIEEKKPIIVLSEWWRSDHLEIFDRYHLQPVIHHEQQIRWLESVKSDRLSVWLKIDSGMNRLGIAAEQTQEIYRRLDAIPSVKEIRLLSHLANADDPEDSYTRRQQNAFELATKDLPCEKSLANSAGVMKWPETHYQWVRPGLILYGASPVQGITAKELGLKPVMTLQARVISIKDVAQGAAVGYGGIHQTRRPTRLGVVGLGYGDGYPRTVDDRACVIIRGQRAPLLGRVSMDMIAVDLTDIGNVKIGDMVTLWGEELNVDEVADWAGTLSYELVSRVTGRVPRVIV